MFIQQYAFNLEIFLDLKSKLKIFFSKKRKKNIEVRLRSFPSKWF